MKMPNRILLAATTVFIGSLPAAVQAQGTASGHAVPADATKQSPAHQFMGDIAPKLADLTQHILSEDIWERPNLSKRERSLITISALIALNRPDQMRSYFSLARGHGVTEPEIIEAITHLAFYAGWPSAITAISVAKDVFGAENVMPAVAK